MPEHIFLGGHGKIDVQRICLVDAGEERAAGHKVANGHGFLGGITGNRSNDLAVIQVHLVLAQSSLRALIVGQGLIPFLLGYGVGGIQGTHAVPFALGVIEGSLRPLISRFIGIALDLEHKLSGLDVVALFIKTLLDDAGDSGSHLGRTRTSRSSLKITGPGNILRLYFIHTDQRRRSLGLLLFLLTAGKTDSHRQSYDKTYKMTHKA